VEKGKGAEGREVDEREEEGKGPPKCGIKLTPVVTHKSHWWHHEERSVVHWKVTLFVDNNEGQSCACARYFIATQLLFFLCDLVFFDSVHLPVSSHCQKSL